VVSHPVRAFQKVWYLIRFGLSKRCGISSGSGFSKGVVSHPVRDPALKVLSYLEANKKLTYWLIENVLHLLTLYPHPDRTNHAGSGFGEPF
jgi:hypothetical protein